MIWHVPFAFARTVPRGPFVVSNTPISEMVQIAGVKEDIATIVTLPAVRPAVVMVEAYKKIPATVGTEAEVLTFTRVGCFEISIDRSTLVAALNRVSPGCAAVITQVIEFAPVNG